MPGSLLIVIITLYFLLVMQGFNIITECSLVSVPCRSPSLLSSQSSSAQHRFVLTETQNEPAKFTLRFIAYITLAHVYANSDLHIQNVCLPLLANTFYFCMLWPYMQISFFQHQLSTPSPSICSPKNHFQILYYFTFTEVNKQCHIPLHKCPRPVLFTDCDNYVLSPVFCPISPASSLFFCPDPAFACCT